MTSSGDPRRIFRQYLESLRSAGVEWLPAPVSAGAREVETVAEIVPADNPASAVGGETAVLFAPSAAAAQIRVEAARHELAVLRAQVSGCTRCSALASTRTQTVFGVGNERPELCFIGEAPGADEDAQGEPFVGAAGQLLNKIIAACQMKREEVYICNILKCRPPGNRTPLPDEVANCRGYLEKQLELLSPRFICALGSTAAHHLLGTTASMAKLRGRFHEYKGIPAIVTYHPAYLLPHRAPHMKKEVWEDMKMLLRRMGRDVG